ncbi:hypothetical protein NPIL_465601, partial [Nephila pilipes]
TRIIGLAEPVPFSPTDPGKCGSKPDEYIDIIIGPPPPHWCPGKTGKTGIWYPLQATHPPEADNNSPVLIFPFLNPFRLPGS